MANFLFTFLISLAKMVPSPATYVFLKFGYSEKATRIWPIFHLEFDATGKSLSEVLIFASTNPQYDDRLFIELQVQYMKIPSSELGENMLCTDIVFVIQNNFFTQHVLSMFSKKKSF